MAESNSLDFQLEQARLLNQARHQAPESHDKNNMERTQTPQQQSELTQKKKLRKIFNKGTAKAKNPVGTVTSKFGPSAWLRWTWYIILGTGGLAALAGASLYLMVHALGHVIMPSTFCRFGDEWFGASSVPGGGGKFLNWIETAAAILLITIEILILFGILILTVLIIDIADNPVETFFEILKTSVMGAF